MSNEKSDLVDIACKQTIIEAKIDNIYQQLFWYDNVPEDEEIVLLVMKWREHRQELIKLGISNSYTN